MKHILSLSICILACAAATRGHAADDLTVISNVTTNGKPDGIETNYISNDHIRTSHAGSTDMIINLKTGVMTNIDNKKKTYYEVTKQDMETMQAKMVEKMNDPKMKQAMAMMQGMGQSMAGSTEVKKTGVSRKVAGFACEEWSISMAQMMTITECVTSDLKYPVQSWAALAEFNESMRKSMSGFGPTAKSGADFAEKMKSIRGFPVASSSTVDAGVVKMTNSSEVTEVRHTAIPDSTWEVPAGFAKVENPMVRALQEHGR
ncbi:MAG TPA: hypothetical protein VGD63_12015 [Steroidobacteraceae bacterium]